MPPEKQFIDEQYTGTMMRDLQAMVAAADRAPNDRFDAVVFLADAKSHLANHAMTSGEVDAWWLMEFAQRELWRAS